LIDCVAETGTFVVIVQLVEPDGIVHVSAVAAQVPLVTIPTVAV
jgi:predicted aconitase with swiveling domain